MKGVACLVCITLWLEAFVVSFVLWLTDQLLLRARAPVTDVEQPLLCDRRGGDGGCRTGL